jgi:DNA repair photolyase
MRTSIIITIIIAPMLPHVSEIELEDGLHELSEAGCEEVDVRSIQCT